MKVCLTPLPPCTPAPMATEYQIPRYLWESFEAVIKAQSVLYVKELAKRLRVSEKELVKRVLPSAGKDDARVVSVTLIDTASDVNQCCARVLHDEITTYCRRPVAHLSEYCPLHQFRRPLVLPPSEDAPVTTEVQRVDDSPDYPVQWVTTDRARILLDSKGHQQGYYRPSKQKVVLFHVHSIEDSAS